MTYIEEDADTVKEVWLENAKENFEECKENQDWRGCRDVIDDVRDKGFNSQAKTLEKELLAAYNQEPVL